MAVLAGISLLRFAVRIHYYARTPYILEIASDAWRYFDTIAAFGAEVNHLSILEHERNSFPCAEFRYKLHSWDPFMMMMILWHPPLPACFGVMNF